MAETNLQTAPAPAPAAAMEAFTLTDALKTDVAKLGEQVIKIAGKEKETQSLATKAVEEFCKMLVQPGEIVSDQALEMLTEMVAACDAKLTKQLNLVLHHPDLQKLEASWRGLHKLDCLSINWATFA